jgi:hypothetical protein
MHTRNAKPRFGSTSMRRLRTLVLAVAVLSGGTIAVSGNSAFSAGAPTDDTVPAFALRWFAQLQDGRIDPSQYAPGYRVQLTADAVQEMSHLLNRYGASPFRAEIMQKGARGDQTFFVVKLLFPRGDAASLLFSFDTAGEITGVVVENMAGD